MNKFIGIGRLTRDADVRIATNGDTQTGIARLTLAVDRRFKKEGAEQTADFISCVAFGKTAEFIEKYTKQGTKIAVEGRIQTGSYTNKDGAKVYTTDVVIEQVEFAESKNSNSDNTQPAPNENTDGWMNVPDGLEDEGLPFN